jgi:hypothetical protein
MENYLISSVSEPLLLIIYGEFNRVNFLEVL